MAGGFENFLNIIMPVLVFIFIGFIFYKIPLIQKGVDTLIEKIKDWKERGDVGSNETTLYNTIEYE